jgi:HEAT repeat protein
MLHNRRQKLREALRDTDEEVRAAAAEALEQLEALLAMDDIVRALKTGNRGQRVRALLALEKVQGSRVYAPLLAALKVADADIRSVAIKVLGHKKHPASVDYLVRHLKDPHPAVRVHAANALGNFRDRRLVPCLAAVLDSEDEELVRSATESLGRIGAVEAEDVLLGLLRDHRPGVRQAAARALGSLGVADSGEGKN